ncbi:MAG: hypothetical protein N2169_03500 [bacterium]|nr:hypothetical protein [bacterium]
MVKKITILLLFLLIHITLKSSAYTIVFNHYNEEMKSYISYILFDNRQSITDYKNHIIYKFDYPSQMVLQELYILKGQSFPSFYKPPIEKDKKNKNMKLGSFAQIIKDNQIMYLQDYSTPSFYKFLDFNLRGLIVSLEDNTKALINNIYTAEKVEYKSYLDYVKAFGNINSGFELILCYPDESKIIFEFLNTKNNKVKVITVDKYYYFTWTEKDYPQNTLFNF